MKEIKLEPFLQAGTVALLIGLAIGLGIALHEAFFFVGLVIALGAAIEWAVQATGEHQHVRHLKMTHRRLRADSARAMNCIAVAIAFMFALSGSSFLYATRVAPGKRAQLASPETAGPFGEVIRGPRGKSEIALTYDAGAEAECFEDLITALESAKVHSTFFVTGNWAQKNRDCAAAITKHGHEVGNHTWNHPNLTQQPDAVVREEISRAEVILNELTGQSPRPFWRAPYGERDDRVLRIASKLGYRSIYWTLDSLDGVEPIKTSQFLIDRIKRQSDQELDGAIILMHVGFKSTAEALPVIIADLQARGFRLVTVSKLLESAAKTPSTATQEMMYKSQVVCRRAIMARQALRVNRSHLKAAENR